MLCQAKETWLNPAEVGSIKDEMIKAKQEGKLGRNFGGYTTGDVRDMIAIGPTATSTLGASYFQNVYDLPKYYGLIDKGELPIFKGHLHGGDDPLRREVIFQLICNQQVKVREIEKSYGIDFETHFADEMPRLNKYAAEGILTFQGDKIVLTDVGQFLSRNVAQVFDRYNRNPLEYKITGP